MSTPTHRDATVDDAEVICDLIGQLAEFEEMADLVDITPASMAEELASADPKACVILAEVDGQVAGMALYVWTFSTFLGRRGIWLEDLIVDPLFRRRGVATALLDELRRRSPGRVEWEVLDWNQGAIELYERQGARAHTGWIKYRVDSDG